MGQPDLPCQDVHQHAQIDGLASSACAEHGDDRGGILYRLSLVRQAPSASGTTGSGTPSGNFPVRKSGTRSAPLAERADTIRAVFGLVMAWWDWSVVMVSCRWDRRQYSVLITRQVLVPSSVFGRQSLHPAPLLRRVPFRSTSRLRWLSDSLAHLPPRLAASPSAALVGIRCCVAARAGVRHFGSGTWRGFRSRCRRAPRTLL